MALNPELHSFSPAYPVGRRPSSTPFPVPYAGEFIFASRDGSYLRVDGDPSFKFSGGGQVFLTNYRLVFVPKKPTQMIQAIEFPLLFIEQFDVKQPVLGANNLHGTCAIVSQPTSKLKWKVSFTNGGMGTMVPLFYATISYIRVASQRPQQQPMYHQQPPQEGKPQEDVSKPPPFVVNAVVDPNDPTMVYVVQPELAEEKERKEPGFPVSKKYN